MAALNWCRRGYKLSYVERGCVRISLADISASCQQPDDVGFSCIRFGVLAFIPGTPVGSVPTAVAAIASGLGIALPSTSWLVQNDPHGLMVATLGSLTLGAGIAESLSLAPLMVGLMSGLTVGVLSPASESIAGTIRRLERPAVVALFLFGGAHFSLNDPQILVLPIAYVVVRVVALRIAAACSRPLSKDLEQDVPGLWRSYLYQGTLTAAVALNFEALMPGQVGTRQGTLLVAAIVSPFVSWNAARDLLRDVGETGASGQTMRTYMLATTM